MSLTDEDAAERGLTPDELADVLSAGANAIPGKSEPAANALALALTAMAAECKNIERSRNSRHN
jgi:hypothetical protein